ncbi:MAG: hypothetical protein JW700_02810 [Candidatus Aenigmarchaeota archaeon]|nr:hypothetical protein [Candidatus Aenigmarchaeota archaeon]
MRKAVIAVAALAILAVAVGTGTAQNVSIEMPSSVTGFFVGLTSSILTVFKQILKQVLIAIANML